MKVLIARNSLQAYHHLRDNFRLGVFLADLLKASHWVAFSSSRDLVAEELTECDVLVITTRLPREKEYTESEIASILDFVQKGGGLLLMANHGDLPGKNANDCTKHDAKLASEFDVNLECSFFAHPRQGERTVISGSVLNNEHSIITGAPGENPVEYIVTNTCCSILCDEGKCLISLPSWMVDKRNGLSPEGRCFACALDAHSGLQPDSKGRIVVTADSGFIGTDLTMLPGPGLIGHGHNLRFIRNAIRWLGGQLG